MTQRIPLAHPGEILREELLAPLGISPYQLAKNIHVPFTRIYEILQGKRAISPDTALRLSRYFGTSERFWLELQSDYDLRRAKEKLGAELETTITPVEQKA